MLILTLIANNITRNHAYKVHHFFWRCNTFICLPIFRNQMRCLSRKTKSGFSAGKQRRNFFRPMFRNLWDLAQFYAHRDRICIIRKVFIMITRTIMVMTRKLVSILVAYFYLHIGQYPVRCGLLIKMGSVIVILLYGYYVEGLYHDYENGNNHKKKMVYLLIIII